MTLIVIKLKFNTIKFSHFIVKVLYYFLDLSHYTASFNRLVFEFFYPYLEIFYKL